MATFAPYQQAPLSPEFFAASAPEVARALVGQVLVHETAEGVTAGMVVETEAYDAGDPASHAFRGRTPRNAPMFGIGGTCYVYRSYGIHWCVNVATGRQDHGAAVLLRALQPLAGLTLMAQRRRCDADAELDPLHLCSGPGKLTQAMDITARHNHALLWEGPLRLVHGPPGILPARIVALPRIGISQAKDVPWRFCLASSLFVSRPRPTGS